MNNEIQKSINEQNKRVIALREDILRHLLNKHPLPGVRFTFIMPPNDLYIGVNVDLEKSNPL